MIRLTPDTLAACYDFLALTDPFEKLGLPHGEDIIFKVIKSRVYFAYYQWDGSRHVITVSGNKIGHVSTLTQVMAHEMIHLRLQLLNIDRRGTANTHSASFRKLAAEVCRIHGFDLKAFY